MWGSFFLPSLVHLSEKMDCNLWLPGNSIGLACMQAGQRTRIQTDSPIPFLTTWCHSSFKNCSAAAKSWETALSQVGCCGFKDSHCFEEGHLESSMADVIRMCTARRIPGALCANTQVLLPALIIQGTCSKHRWALVGSLKRQGSAECKPPGSHPGL